MIKGNVWDVPVDVFRRLWTQSYSSILSWKMTNDSIGDSMHVLIVLRYDGKLQEGNK